MNKQLEKLYEEFCAELIPPGGKSIADAKWADRLWKRYVEEAYILGEIKVLKELVKDLELKAGKNVSILKWLKIILLT